MTPERRMAGLAAYHGISYDEAQARYGVRPVPDLAWTRDERRSARVRALADLHGVTIDVAESRMQTFELRRARRARHMEALRQLHIRSGYRLYWLCRLYGWLTRAYA